MRPGIVSVYEPLVPIVDQSVLVPELTPDVSVQSVNPSSIVLDSTDPSTTPVQVGAILVSGEGEGYLRRVTAVHQTGEDVLVETVDAALTDVFQQADISASDMFGADDFAKVGIPVEKDGSVSIRMDHVRAFGNGGTTIDYDGSLEFAPGVDVNLRINDYSVTYFKFDAVGALRLNFDVWAQTSQTGGLEYERSLFELLHQSKPKKYIYRQIGWAPVVIIVELDLLLGGRISATGAASIRGGFESTSTVQLMGEYATGSWSGDADVDLSASLHEPIWSGGSNLDGRFYLKPKLSAKLYGVTGPHVACMPYTNFKVEPVPAPLRASLGAGIDAKLAFDLVDLETFGLGFDAGYEHEFSGPYYALWSYTAPANNAPTISSVSPNPVPGSNTAQTLTINGTGFQSGCTVRLIDITNGGTFDKTPTSLTATQVQISANFTNATATWSAQVRNPDGGQSSAFQFQVQRQTTNPTISSVSPNPVPGSNTAQTLTINGTGFQSGCTVRIKDISYGGTYDKTPTSVSSTQVRISANFTNTTATWSAQVLNPDGGQSNVVNFQVQRMK